MSEIEATRDTIGRVLGRTPSGIFVLTASDGEGNETGMLVSWVQQASFEPPMVTVAVNRQRYLHDWLRSAPGLALNVVAESQTALLKHFARGFEPEQPAFEGLDVRRGATGVPVLDAALGTLESRIAGQMEAGDHVVYLLEVLHASTGEAFEKEPMVHVRRNGFRY
jgi:flavin reductase (DIM6/NTAB) family NADH-FMN oxidoreductase RutF